MGRAAARAGQPFGQRRLADSVLQYNAVRQREWLGEMEQVRDDMNVTSPNQRGTCQRSAAQSTMAWQRPVATMREEPTITLQRNTDEMISLPTSSHSARYLVALLASLSATACADGPKQPLPRSNPVTLQNTVSETGHLCGVRSAQQTPDGVEVRFTKPTLVLARFDGKARRVMVDSTRPAETLPPGAEVSAPAVLALPGDTISIPIGAHSGCSIEARVKDGALGLAVTLGVGAPGLEPYWKTDFIPAE